MPSLSMLVSYKDLLLAEGAYLNSYHPNQSVNQVDLDMNDLYISSKLA